MVPCGELRSRSLPVAQARKIDYFMTSRNGGSIECRTVPVGPHMNETEVWPPLGWKDEDTSVRKALSRKKPRLEHTSLETRGE